MTSKPVAHLGFGPPADEALIARVEAAVGPLPEDVLALMRQFNGLSCAVATRKKGHGVALPERAGAITGGWPASGRAGRSSSHARPHGTGRRGGEAPITGECSAAR